MEIKTTKELRAYSGANPLYQNMFIENYNLNKKWVAVDDLLAELKDYWDLLIKDNQVQMAGSIAVFKGKIESLDNNGQV